MSTSFFTTGVSALFEMATADAVRILPAHLQPIELRPQRSVLSVSAFHFRESAVGPYAELIFSVVVPPIIDDLSRFPKAGFYPFLAATSSAASRRHLLEDRRIPTWPHNVDAEFIERPDRIRIRMSSLAQPVIDFTVTQHKWHATSHLLQTHMMDGERRLKADVEISGNYTMHEHEAGQLTLFAHPMTAALTIDEVAPYPFREHWLKEGTQLFHPVEPV